MTGELLLIYAVGFIVGPIAFWWMPNQQFSDERPHLLKIIDFYLTTVPGIFLIPPFPLIVIVPCMLIALIDPFFPFTEFDVSIGLIIGRAYLLFGLYYLLRRYVVYKQYDCFDG